MKVVQPTLTHCLLSHAKYHYSGNQRTEVQSKRVHLRAWGRNYTYFSYISLARAYVTVAFWGGLEISVPDWEARYKLQLPLLFT